MNRKIEKKIQNKVWDNREKKLWHRTLGVLCALAVTTTVGLLTLPAITQEHQDCGMVAHTHGKGCYDAEGNLVCTLPEHVHTADCGNVRKVQICQEQEHTHTAACYGPVMVLSCGQEEHTHGEGCYDAEGKLICKKQEHTHSDSCYTPDKVLVCKTEEHTHGDGCWEEQSVLVCKTEEHTHGEGCYDAEGNLICQKTEHTHGPECRETRKVLVCSKPEHTHGEDCYQIRTELKCGMKEHTHTESCFRYDKIDPEETKVPGSEETTVPDSTAGTTAPTVSETTVPETTTETVPETTAETLDPWDQKLQDLPLTGDWTKDLIAVAMSQEGYVPQPEDSRFQPGFVRFCLGRAGIPGEVLLLNDSLGLWADALQQEKLTETDRIPGEGDLIFLDENQDTIADGVEIVTAVRVEDTPVSFETVSCGLTKGVHTVKRFLDDGDLMAVCSLAQLQEKYREEKIPDTASFTFEDETMQVQVSITGLTVRLPENTRLLVSRLDGESPDMGMFDMKLLDGDSPVLLNPEAEVSVSVKLQKPLFAPDQVGKDSELQILTFELPENSAPVETTGETTEPGETEQPQDPTQEKKPSSPSAFVRSRPSAPTKPGYQEVAGTYGGLDQGVTEVNFKTKGISPFGVKLKKPPKAPASEEVPEFWQIISDPSQLKPGCKILIGNENGQIMKYIPGTGAPTIDNAAHEISCMPVPWRAGLVQINTDPSLGKDCTNAVFTYTEGQPLSFVSGGKTWYIDHKDQVGTKIPVTDTKPANMNTVISGKNCAIKIGTKYLEYYKKQFQIYSESTPMTIYMALDNLEEPPRPAPIEKPGGGDTQKPEYKPVRPVSPVQNSSYEVENASDPLNPIMGQAVSDASTSQIESLFGSKTPGEGQTEYQANEGDNGKAVADKSVVYGKDDYDAFATYNQGKYKDDFSVTLSALGQIIKVSDKNIAMPLDVMFVLDTSGSMKEDYDKTTRYEALVNALNVTATELFKTKIDGKTVENHNRMGVAAFSGDSEIMVPLGEYVPTKGEYFSAGGAEIKAVCKPKDSKKPLNKSRAIDGGTFTQLGIATGANALAAVPDTTYTYVDPDTNTSISIPRRPIIIVISDGEPTYCTNEYYSVKSSIGNGMADEKNAQGIMGYYTILTANYYKDVVGYHYGNAAAMYTVGIDMDKASSKTAVASPTHKKTILNPTAGNISALLAETAYPMVEQQMNYLLTGNAAELEKEGWDQKINGIPVELPNGYRGNYAYADGSYITSNLSDLKNKLQSIVTENQSVITMPYQTLNDTNITITDQIGTGMELKSAPVLRVAGKNFQPKPKTPPAPNSTTTYTYAGKVQMDPSINMWVDLSTVSVQVTAAADGSQTVTMNIPPYDLPIFTADKNRTWLLHALPIRLIYQVGLSQSGIDQIEALEPGRTATFYTNRFQESKPGSSAALNVESTNPYYSDAQKYQELNLSKTSNATGTAADSRAVTKQDGSTGISVNQALGNNGKLTYKKPGDPLELTVKKQWLDAEGNVITPPGAGKPQLPKSVSFKLKRSYTDGGTVKTEYIQARGKDKVFTLNGKNDWQILITEEILNETPGREYTYSVEEVVQEGFDFKVSYVGNELKPGTAEPPYVITIRNQYKYGDIVLPETGGLGEGTIWGAGILLALGTLIFMFVQEHKSREGRRGA